MSNAFRTNLEAAIAHLVGKGKIKRDADVVERLKISKGTLSAYKSGATRASKNFVQAFEQAYHINLADFSIEPDNTNTQNPEPDMNNCEKAFLENEFLRTRVSDLERTIQDKEEIIVLQRQLLGGASGKAMTA